MKQQSIDTALSTATLFCHLNRDAAEPKYTFLDLAASTGQVAAALSACWMVHIFV